MSSIRNSLMLLLWFTIFTGIIYPLMITFTASILLIDQAQGSLVRERGTVVGSSLIGQEFRAPHYFWGRPSSAAEAPYNGVGSAASNYGPLNPEFLSSIATRCEQLQQLTLEPRPIPVDLVTASASGLDPHISPAAARYQIDRIAAARRISREQLLGLVDQYCEGRQWGIFGEPRVQVWLLNRELDLRYPVNLVKQP